MMFSFVVHCVDSEFRFQDLLSGGGRCKSSSSVSTHRMAIIFCFLLTTTYRGGGNGGRGAFSRPPSDFAGIEKTAEGKRNNLSLFALQIFEHSAASLHSTYFP